MKNYSSLTLTFLLTCVMLMACVGRNRHFQWPFDRDSLEAKGNGEVEDSRANDKKTEADKTPEKDSESHTPVGAIALIKAYPDFHLCYEDNAIVFPDGTRIVYDDGKTKNFQEQLDESDIEDMFAMPYDTSAVPGFQHDGGRSRCEALYKKMYGSSAKEVERNLTTIDWFDEEVQITKVNGVDRQLEAVEKEIERHPELNKYATPHAGSFYWRPVRGAKRLSAHSYGMTLDVNTTYSNFWQWTNRTNDESKEIKYENKVPMALVKIFQRHGFIWGGHWYHYDTMHFEYRPDILIYNHLL